MLPGLLSIVAVVGGAASVLLFAQIGQLHGDTYELIVLSDEARGVLKGSDVWLEGQKVGVVEELQFRPPTTDTLTRLRIPIKVLTQYQSFIRHDSRVQIRSGGSLIGAPVVYISTGTPNSPTLKDGDIVPLSARQVDLEGITSAFAIATRDIPSIIDNVKSMAGNATDVVKRVGELNDGRARFVPILANAARLGDNGVHGNGTVALLLRDDTLIGRAKRAMARADSLVAAVNAPGSLAMRARSDSGLARALADTRDEISIVRARLAEPRGTAGRVLNDKVIFDELSRTQKLLGDVIADFKKHPGRYIIF
ncbi:MAG: MlaD family protein [Gemmatimonadota bacterium]|nr:MlaD family protein [Gemmatimonadota bacterium]